jgi:isochorismate hydrolase
MIRPADSVAGQGIKTRRREAPRLAFYRACFFAGHSFAVRRSRLVFGFASGSQVKRLVPAGVSTAWAVQATARDAHDRDYQVVVVEDACAAASENEHKTSMELCKAAVRRGADVSSVRQHSASTTRH